MNNMSEIENISYIDKIDYIKWHVALNMYTES